MNNNIYFSKKKYINDYLNFDWKKYLNNYSDLQPMKTKQELWYHWLNYGRYEGRIIDDYCNKNNDEYNNFDWETYVNKYDDLKHIENKDDAWKHWIIYGKNENRIICDSLINEKEKENEEFIKFNWKTYIENYDDLKHIETKETAWNHWINYGISESRTCEDLFKICLNEFNEIIKEEDSLENCDYSLNKIYFKKKYTHCGKHFFGWKSAMNYLLNNLKCSNLNLNKKYYLDEWIEKLLLWGNKIQNNQILKDIEINNLQLITFLHCPPFDSYNELSNELSNDLLLNDELLLNKNVFEIIDKNNLYDSITFLYVFSLDHKNYIINTYPKFKKKVLSIYHPIDIDNCNENELFNICNFILNKNIYHVGWWLRNFTTFLNFIPPFEFKKKFLVKQEFQQQFDNKFLNNAIDKNIDVVYEVNDEEYVKIFNNSCIFCDLVDCVANNIVLECIKYNTPIIIKKLPSIEEYLGTEYPLFFNDEKELEIFKDEEIFIEKIKEATLYLKEMDKIHLTLESFSKKINYDVNKLQTNIDTYKLTMLYYLNNEKEDIEKYIYDFNSQRNKEIKLIIINSLKSKTLKKYICKNITVINIEQNLNMKEIYQLFVQNSTTEYLTSLTDYNILNNKNYSDLCINYLDQNPTHDIIFLKQNSYSTDLSNDLRDLSDDLRDLSDDSTNLSDDSSDLSGDFSDLSNDLSDLSSDLSDLSNDLSDLSCDLNNNCKFVEKNVSLLNLTQIQNYDFNNTNILWRKSVHSYVNYSNNNYFVNCYKNHTNIIEITLN